MGFLDSFFNGNSNDTLSKLKRIAENTMKEAGEAFKASEVMTPDHARDASSDTDKNSANTDPAPFGVSWGEQMPAEENQYNYPGNYVQYFHSIYTEAFPSYLITKESLLKGKITVITFWEGNRKALVVELLSEHSSSRALRGSCLRQQLPYLRFYYNHHGWWNTKSYVINRTKNALGI